MLGLKDAQRKQALLSSIKNDNNNLTEAFRDNVVIDYACFKAQEMDQRQVFELLQLISMFIYNMEAGHAKVKMEEVFQHLGNTYFAWISGTEAEAVYYYRIHSPVWQFSKNPPEPNHDHTHIVVRMPNVNDYGKDLLRLHMITQPH